MGTVTVPADTRNASSVDYQQINDAAKTAYFKRTGQVSTITGATFAHVIRREKEFTKKYLKDSYTVPGTTDPNDSVVMYLQEMVDRLENMLSTNLPSQVDPRIIKAMANANHQACIMYLDSLLQGVYQNENTQPLPPSSRPKYDSSSSETDYFVAYIEAIGNV